MHNNLEQVQTLVPVSKVSTGEEPFHPPQDESFPRSNCADHKITDDKCAKGDLPLTKFLNLNIGVLGHVDSGKTSLVKVLSSVASTACFDKNPQSRQRGITLDLGFSSFCAQLPERLRIPGDSVEWIQFTLVDCPGHASLIRTIIGGAQIMDMMLLVVDVTKGIQTQTAECLVIGEVTCDKMIIALNKIDLLPEHKRSAAIERMTKRLQKTLLTTKFGSCCIIPVSAKPGGAEECGSAAYGLEELIDAMKDLSYRPMRDSQGPFVFSVDHCFLIKGQGTVMTGTVICGSAGVNDNIEIPSLKITKKIKSMQMFKKNISYAMQGDRVGICVTQFDPKQLERGLICTPKTLQVVNAAIIKLSKVAYFKGNVATKSKFHITIGHDTVMGQGTFFGRYIEEDTLKVENKIFDFANDYHYQDELCSAANSSESSVSDNECANLKKFLTEQFALLEFETSITCAMNFLVIGSKLDTDIQTNTCRIAFHGRVVMPIVDPNYLVSTLPQLHIYKKKVREGFVERMIDENNIVCSGLFKKETDIKAFIGLKVRLSVGDHGIIESGFGQSGKFKVRVPHGLSKEALLKLSKKSDKKSKTKLQHVGDGRIELPHIPEELPASESSTPISVLLEFKRYIFDPHKRMIQI